MRLTRTHETTVNGIEHTYKYKLSCHDMNGVDKVEMKLKSVGGQYCSYSGNGYMEVDLKDVPTEVMAVYINRLEEIARELRGHE